jgi:hypothetical protein
VLDEIDREEGVYEGLFARRLLSAEIGGRAYTTWAYCYMKPVDADNEIASGVFESAAGTAAQT